LVKTGQLVAEGQSRATRYRISATTQLFAIIDLASYFEKEIDEYVKKAKGRYCNCNWLKS
jgi:hypothetical protein